MLLQTRRNHLLNLWSRIKTSGLILQQDNFRLAFTVTRTVKCKNRGPKKAAGLLLLEIFQDKVRQTCQVWHSSHWSCSEARRQVTCWGAAHPYLPALVWNQSEKKNTENTFEILFPLLSFFFPPPTIYHFKNGWFQLYSECWPKFKILFELTLFLLPQNEAKTACGIKQPLQPN